MFVVVVFVAVVAVIVVVVAVVVAAVVAAVAAAFVVVVAVVVVAVVVVAASAVVVSSFPTFRCNSQNITVVSSYCFTQHLKKINTQSNTIYEPSYPTVQQFIIRNLHHVNDVEPCPYLLFTVAILDGIIGDSLEIVLEICVCVGIAVRKIAHIIYMRKFL